MAEVILFLLSILSFSLVAGVILFQLDKQRNQHVKEMKLMDQKIHTSLEFEDFKKEVEAFKRDLAEQRRKLESLALKINLKV